MGPTSMARGPRPDLTGHVRGFIGSSFTKSARPASVPRLFGEQGRSGSGETTLRKVASPSPATLGRSGQNGSGQRGRGYLLTEPPPCSRHRRPPPPSPFHQRRADAVLRPQRDQRVRDHGMPRDQAHPPALRERGDDEQPLGPREGFADAAARPASEREVGVLGTRRDAGSRCRP